MQPMQSLCGKDMRCSGMLANAMKSASLAANALPLQRGANTFRVFVDARYDGRFQDVIFHQKQLPEIKAMICSILVGYAWDKANPYVKNARSRLDTLVELCRAA